MPGNIAHGFQYQRIADAFFRQTINELFAQPFGSVIVSM